MSIEETVNCDEAVTRFMKINNLDDADSFQAQHDVFDVKVSLSEMKCGSANSKAFVNFVKC